VQKDTSAGVHVRSGGANKVQKKSGFNKKMQHWVDRTTVSCVIKKVVKKPAIASQTNLLLLYEVNLQLQLKTSVIGLTKSSGSPA
jgi:hypothetical protein